MGAGWRNARNAFLRRQHPACLLDSALNSRHSRGGEDTDSFSYDIKPSPPTDKAVSFHAICLVDVNADKASNFADENLVHSDPAVVI
jgi:hypothetical protein